MKNELLNMFKHLVLVLQLKFLNYLQKYRKKVRTTWNFGNIFLQSTGTLIQD